MPGKYSLWLINFNDSLWSAYHLKKNHNWNNRLYMDLNNGFINCNRNTNCSPKFVYYFSVTQSKASFPTSEAIRSGHETEFYQFTWDRSGVTLSHLLCSFRTSHGFSSCAPWLIWIVINLTEMSPWRKIDLYIKLKKTELLPDWIHGRESLPPYMGGKNSLSKAYIASSLKKKKSSCYGRK